MPRKKKEVQTESQIDELFVIVKGFNITGEDGKETRFDAGTDEHPVFVREKDFEPDVWKDLRHEKAVVLFEKDTLRPNESIAAEIIK